LEKYDDDNDDSDINIDWMSIGENFKVLATDTLDYYKLKQNKLWFDE